MLPAQGGGGAADIESAGIRKLVSQHLTLYTDLPSRPAVDELPQVFDAAVPQWADFFGFDRATIEDWHVIACVIRDKQRFRDLGLLPASLPPFLNGFQRHDDIWVYEQPSDYYRRHLLLHEGVHAVMHRHFGNGGPSWYREGMAELLGTHRWRNGKLTMGYFPQNRDEVEHWGRIKIINTDIQADAAKSVRDVIGFRSRVFMDVEAYAWSWAFVTFCHQHPILRNMFPTLQTKLGDSSRAVTNAMLQAYGEDAARIDAAWDVFLKHLDYGYDVAADAIHYSADEQPLTTEWTTTNIDAAKGWQATGLIVPTNRGVEIQAAGRYEVGQEPKPWLCEPQGVTIKYYQGKPLGMLLGAIGEAPYKTFEIGRRKKLGPSSGGMLFLRINERSDGLHDNAGKVTIRVRATDS